MAAFDDAALDARLTQLRQSDPVAFIEALFKTFYAPLGGVVYRVVPDRAVVEDLLQDVFFKVWQGLAGLPEITSHRAYLTRMALNAALRYRQRDQRQVAWDEALPDATRPFAPDALDQLHATETADAIAAALTKLPPQCRIIFELSRYEEMSYQQIAEALELAPKTVDNQMGKALRILRQELAGVLKNLYGVLFWLLVVPASWLAVRAGHQPKLRLSTGPPEVYEPSRRGSAAVGYLCRIAAPFSSPDL